MGRNDIGGHADHVDRPRWIDAGTPALQHPDRLQPYQCHCQESYPQSRRPRDGDAPVRGRVASGVSGALKDLLEVAAVRNVEDHRVASAEQRLAKALPVAVMQDAIPPVSTGVLGDQHYVDAALLRRQV